MASLGLVLFAASCRVSPPPAGHVPRGGAFPEASSHSDSRAIATASVDAGSSAREDASFRASPSPPRGQSEFPWADPLSSERDPFLAGATARGWVVERKTSLHTNKGFAAFETSLRRNATRARLVGVEFLSSPSCASVIGITHGLSLCLQQATSRARDPAAWLAKILERQPSGIFDAKALAVDVARAGLTGKLERSRDFAPFRADIDHWTATLNYGDRYMDLNYFDYDHAWSQGRVLAHERGVVIAEVCSLCAEGPLGPPDPPAPGHPTAPRATLEDNASAAELTKSLVAHGNAHGIKIRTR